MTKITLNNKRLNNIKAHKDPFSALCRAIISQQLGVNAAESIRKKFFAVFNDKPTPLTVSKLKTSKFKSTGISKQKESYLKDLALKFLDGTVDPKNFSRMSDEEIKEHLIQVKGIGVWSAEMFLIFTLKRENVLPVGDLGIQHGFKKYFKLRKLPSEAKMYELAKPYKGKYTELALFLWEYKDNN